MRVLVTGATGFIGKQVVKQLNDSGVDVVTMGRRPSNSANQHFKLDFLATEDFSTQFKEARASHLIHLAWYVEHGKFWSSTMNMDWIKTTANLVDAFCKGGGQHITIAGSCAEYDWDYGVCNEEHTPLNPRSVYGIAKNATRQICQITCAKAEVPLAWGRIFTPYGKSEPTTRLLPSLAEVFKKNKAPFGVNLDSYRDFLHVTDVANALISLSIGNAKGNINISSGEPVRLREIAELMAGKMAADPAMVLELSSNRLDEPKYLVGTNDCLLGLGWNKRVSLVDGLNDFYK